MDLFSEKEFLDSTGVCRESSALSEDDMLHIVVNGKYGKDSLVTYVSLSPDDWDENYRLRNKQMHNIRICFTPVDGYGQHRKELAAAFPFAFVVRVFGNLFSHMTPKADRTMQTLFRQNYIVVPFGKEKCYGLDFRKLNVRRIGNSRNNSYVVDVFAGGNIITDTLYEANNGRGLNTSYLMSRRMSRINFSKVYDAFENEINSVEEVLS